MKWRCSPNQIIIPAYKVTTTTMWEEKYPPPPLSHPPQMVMNERLNIGMELRFFFLIVF